MSRLGGAGLLVAVGLAAIGWACAAAAPAYDWGLPKGVRPPVAPADNPMTAAKVELGRRLFYDADLSSDGTLSCASCHVQRHAFADSVATHPGVQGAPGRRNAMPLANVGRLSPLTWADPSLRTLEQQAAVPIAGEHPVEMGMHGREAEIARRLVADPCYREMFAAAFPEAGGEITFGGAVRAIGAFQRTLLSWNSAFDRGALSPEERAGAALFRARGCAGCHTGPDLTDRAFHAVAAPREADLGLAEKTGRAGDRGRFRTPSLRNVALTAPYLHDGSASTLAVAILSHQDAARSLTQDEVVLIAGFLGSLTDEAFVRDPRFALPKSFCGKGRVN